MREIRVIDGIKKDREWGRKRTGERRRWPNYNCPQCEPSLFEEYELQRDKESQTNHNVRNTQQKRRADWVCLVFEILITHSYLRCTKCTRGKKIVGCSGDVSFKRSSCLLKAWQLLCKCSILFSVFLLKKLLPWCTDRSNVHLSKFMFCLDKRFENEPWFMWLSYYTAPLRSPSSCWCYLENWESWFNNRHILYF